MKAKQRPPVNENRNAKSKANQIKKKPMLHKKPAKQSGSVTKNPAASKARLDLKRLKKLLHTTKDKPEVPEKTGVSKPTPLNPAIKPKKNPKTGLEDQKSSALTSQQGKPKFFKLKPKPTLLEAAKNRLEAARFRHLNEQLYTLTSHEAVQLFKEDPKAFNVYHQGFQQQVQKWPVNPIDLIVASIKKMSKQKVIADFGCGEAKLAQSVPHKVHSFDLVAANEHVTACDMAHVPLEVKSVDVAIFCLSLMGTNIPDFLLEANRVLRMGGLLKVAEVESRCENVDGFLKVIEKYGFELVSKDMKDVFFLAEFKKTAGIKSKPQWGDLVLKPCIYKKR